MPPTLRRPLLLVTALLVLLSTVLACSAPAAAPTPAQPTAAAKAPAAPAQPTSAPAAAQPTSAPAAAPAQATAAPAAKAATTGGAQLVYGRAADSATLDPGENASGEDKRVTYQIYESLVDTAIDKDGRSTIVPLLAEKWDTSADGKEWTFTLRQGVKFHDGTDLDADAVVFAFDRQRDPNHPYYPKKQKFWASQFGDLITKVEALDKQRVKFTLKQPFGPFLTNLAGPLGQIPSPTAVKKFGADFGTNPVGTGPFKLVQWVTGDRIVLERFDGYWRKPVALDRIIFRAIPDPAARYAEIQAGNIDVAIDIDPDNHSRAKADPNLQVLYRPSLNVGFLYINIARKPFDNVKVRQAVAHAIDKQAIIDAFYSGIGRTAKNVLPPSVWGYNDDVVDYKYDPARAKQLLAEAGFPNGFDTTLWVMPVSRPYAPKPKEIGEALYSYLNAVGIRGKITSFDWTTYLAKTDAGEADLFMYGQTNTPDPHNFLHWFFGATSPKNSYNDPEVQKLLNDAATKTKIEERAPLYFKAQAMLHDGVPAVPFAHTTPIVLARKGVQGLVPSAVDNDELRVVSISR